MRTILQATLRGVVVSIVGGMLVAAQGRAQFTPPVRDLGPQSGVLLTDSVARAHDAGLSWILPISRDFSHATPKICRALIERVDHQLGRWTGWDTVVVSTRHDTLASEALALGRTCATRFTAENVDRDQLNDLFRLALTLDNVPLALAALDRQLREAKTPSDHGTTLIDAVVAFADARPGRLATAESLLTRFDALASSQPWWVLIARQELLNRASRDTFDTTHMRRLRQQNLTAYQSLSPVARTFVGEQGGAGASSIDVVEALADVPLRQRCNDLYNGFVSWPQAAQPEDQTQLQDTVSGYDPTSRRFATLIRTNCLMDTLPERQIFPPLPKQTWFAAGSVTAEETPALPVPGHVTLLIETPLGAGRSTADLAGYRRLYETYHAQGLDAVLLVRTQANRLWASGLQTPAQVAKTVAWYFHEYLQIPIPVLVMQSGEPYYNGALYGRDGKPITVLQPPVIMEAFVRKALGLRAQ